MVRRKPSKKKTIPDPPLTVRNVILAVGEIIGPKGNQHSNGNPRHDIYLEGSLVLVTDVPRQVSIEVHLMSSDGSIPKDRGKFYIMADVNKAITSTGPLFKVEFERLKPQQHRCPVCNGNRWASGPTYSGRTAELVAEAVFPVAERLLAGIVSGDDPDDRPSRLIVDRHTPGGWRLFDVYGDDVVDEPDGPGYGIYVELRKTFTCPVHGRITASEYEPNV